MDKSTRFVVVAKSTFKTINQGSWTQRDNESKGKLEFEVFRLSAQGLISISKLSLDVFPGIPTDSAQFITIPDYLAAVTGCHLCVVYLKEKTKRIFEVYEINEKEKSLKLKNFFEMDKSLPLTAIIAIKERVFLGFPGKVGYVNLSETKLGFHLIHEWKEQTLAGTTSFLKSIDAFAYNSTTKTLIAVDDEEWPKYAFTYDLNQEPPKMKVKFDLPTGANEYYKFVVNHGDTLVLTAEYSLRNSQGNKIYLLFGTKLKETLIESTSLSKDKGPDLFIGTKYTKYSAVGLLNKSIIIVSANERGVMAIPSDKIKKKKNEYGYEISVPNGVKVLKVGTIAQDLITTADTSLAFVLGTQNENSVLCEVKWNDSKSDLEIVRSHQIQGTYQRLFVEV